MQDIIRRLKSIIERKGDKRNVVVLSLSLLFLQLEGDTSDGSSLNSLHQVSGESSNLVSESLRRDDGDLITDLLVGVEVYRITMSVPKARRGRGIAKD